jgi:hypothetical protein
MDGANAPVPGASPDMVRSGYEKIPRAIILSHRDGVCSRYLQEDPVSATDHVPAWDPNAGRYIARRGDEIIATAATYDELSDKLDQAAVPWADLLIEYVGPTDRIHIELRIFYRLTPLGPVSDPTIPVKVATSAGPRAHRFVFVHHGG